MVPRRGSAFATGILILTLGMTGCAPRGPTSPTPSPLPTAGETPTPTPAPTASIITIEVPADGTRVAVPLAMSGAANTFEAALRIDAIGPTGAVLCVRDILATSGSGTPGTWSTSLAFPPPVGDQEVTLRAYELSAEDGAIVNLVERNVTVSADRPAIFITAPVCGTTLAAGSTLSVTGRAFVFEAQLTLELRDASGSAVASKHVVAARGDAESDFAATITIPTGLPIGSYDLVAFSTSARDGSPEHEFAIPLTIT